mmetsp:Transcript_2465/g.5333  ORF Transcript_2465/g.5333 Transcript_2465/m.5333 type:complete len:610 (-) Transcript_2465:64-1893(-)
MAAAETAPENPGASKTDSNEPPAPPSAIAQVPDLLLQTLPPEAAGSDLASEWYIQDSTSGETLGPFKVSELCVRWRKDEVDGLTRVWRSGLQSWRPLTEVPDLKAALQRLAGGSGSGGLTADDEVGEKTAAEQGVKRARRPPLDEVPLYHTYTNQKGVLFVFDVAENDWKLSDIYEALVSEEQALHKEQKRSKLAETTEAQESAIPEEAEDFIKECLAEASILPGAGAPGLKGQSARQAAAKAAAAAAQAATQAAQGNGANEGDEPEMSAEKQAKAQKRREYRERKKLKRQAGLFVKAQENPNVYISGLPPDVTVSELTVLAKRAGVLKVDPDTGDSRVRVYTDDDGRCKGDALVTYANVASVELAVNFLHEFEIRPNCRIAVQQADFEDVQGPKMSKAELQAAAAARGCTKEKDRTRYMAAKNLEKEAVSWSGDTDDGTGRRTVVLKHMFTLEEAEKEGPGFYTELAQEIQEECTKIGEVVKVKPLERHKLGIVCVKFKTSGEAEECIRVMDGRFCSGRTVEASFHDGKTDLMAVGTVRPPPPASRPASAATANPEVQQEAAVSVEENVTSASPAAESTGEVRQKTLEEELDEQSSDSDEELRVRVEE